MMNNISYYTQLPFWTLLHSDEQELVRKKSYIKFFPHKTYIHGNGNIAPGYLFILFGKLRAYLCSNEGREINLFYTNQYESCIVYMMEEFYNINIDTLENTKLIIIPKKYFHIIIESNNKILKYIQEITLLRFRSVISVINQISLTRLDKRIAKFLVDLYDFQHSNKLFVMQQEIADNVNAVRVSVSRILKHFQSDGIIELNRGCITIKDYYKLKYIAS